MHMMMFVIKIWRIVITASTILYILRSRMITIISPINYPNINKAPSHLTWSQGSFIEEAREATAHSESPAALMTGLT